MPEVLAMIGEIAEISAFMIPWLPRRWPARTVSGNARLSRPRQQLHKAHKLSGFGYRVISKLRASSLVSLRWC